MKIQLPKNWKEIAGVVPLSYGLLEGKIKSFEFSSKPQADEFINWLTSNGYDDYSLSDIRKSLNGYEVKMLPQYAHDEAKIKKSADDIEIGD